MKQIITRAGAKLWQVARHKMVMLMVGGAIGTWLRYVVGKWIGEQGWAKGFPYGTMFINVSGSLVLGAADALIRRRLPLGYQDLYLLVGIGFCGGYTTFSTFEFETYQLIIDHSYLRAAYNVFGSVAAGFAGVVLGVALVNALFPRTL